MGLGWGATPPWVRRRFAVLAALVLLGPVCPARAADPGDDQLIDPVPAASAPRASSSRGTVAPSRRARGTSTVIENFPDQIDVPAGQSVIVRLRRPAQRVAIAEPDVADVVLVSPSEILINGKGRRYISQTGEPVILEAQTSLIVWDKNGVSRGRALYYNRFRR